MNIWSSIPYVGTGFGLVAFIVAALLYAYRARLGQRAEIIKSAPAEERLAAIETTAEALGVDASRARAFSLEVIAFSTARATMRSRQERATATARARWAPTTCGPPCACAHPTARSTRAPAASARPARRTRPRRCAPTWKNARRDLPTFDRPRKATSGSTGAGKWPGSLTDIMNRASTRMNQFDGSRPNLQAQ